MGRDGKKSPPHYVREWRVYRNMTQDELADKAGIDRTAVSKIEAGKKPLMQDRLGAFAKALRIDIPQIYEKPPAVEREAGDNTENMVAPETVARLSSQRGGARSYEPLTDEAPVIGRVQAGAWTEAYQLPEGEWEWMALPRDDRFPGVQQYLFHNIGESMNRVCPNGGWWAAVLFRDLVGQGPSIDQYVIVERVRKDGLVEATVKLFKLGPDKKPWLYPDSTDPTFKPIPLEGGGDIDEIRIIGRATRAITPLL